MIKRIFTLRYRPFPSPNATMHTCPSIQMGTASPSYMMASRPGLARQPGTTRPPRYIPCLSVYQVRFSIYSKDFLRAGPTSGNIHPLCKTRALLPFNINNVSITSTSATNAILLHGIPRIPIFVLFLPFLLIEGSLF